MTFSDGLDECAKSALTADFDSVPWDDAPEWRKNVARAVAQAALDTTNPDAVRMAWFTEMTRLGWRWGREIDETQREHPGIITGELTRGGARHWESVIAQVRATGRLIGVRMTGL